MGVPTPLHERTGPLCKSMKWKEWAGYFAAEKYDSAHDLEYFAIRESAGLLDVSPLYKYDLKGPDAAALADRILARDCTRIQDGQVAYSCWCDEEGKVIDDGAVFKFSAEHWRITSANPTWRWLNLNARGLDVQLSDTSQDLAAVALQGPRSRAILNGVCEHSLDKLRFFRMQETSIAGVPVVVSRTGYTGDLGYEVWMPAAQACQVWDALIEGGRNHALTPAGLLALDMARVEAGFILIDVDFKSSQHALTEAQKSSPYEIGLGWTVHLDKRPFVGQKALVRESRRGASWSLVGLEVDMLEVERLFDKQGLPISLPGTAWRSVIPVFDGSHQAGWATSGLWSPLLKRNVALATVKSAYAKPGTELKIEYLIDYYRELVTARVVEKPFFDPARKKSLA